MKDHLTPLAAEPTWQKLSFSVVAFVGNAVAGVTFDGAYKGLLFVLAVVNLAWALLNIRKLWREQHRRPPDIGV